MRIHSIAMWALVLALGPTGVQAQYTNYMRPGVTFNNIYAAQADITLSNMIRQSQMTSYLNGVKASMAATQGRRAASPPPPPPAHAAPAAPRQPLTATDFKPAGARNAPERISAAVADPAGRAQMAKACREILATIEATEGFRRNNVASAITLVTAISIQVLTGREFDDAQAQGLLQIVNDEIVASGRLRNVPNEKLTRLYDTLVISGGLMAGIAHNAAESNDREMMEVARAMARDALASLGLVS